MDPANSLEFLARYGLVILPALVVAEQFGIPLPAVPALLGVGALAATGQVSIPLVLGAVVTVALSVDFAWYELGRRRGPDVLAKLCRMSPEPDACVSKAKNVFAHYGAGRRGHAGREICAGAYHGHAAAGRRRRDGSRPVRPL